LSARIAFSKASRAALESGRRFCSLNTVRPFDERERLFARDKGILHLFL
jgi:hypothetical protein